MGLPYYAKSEVLSASTEAASLKEVVGPEPLHDEEFYPPQPRRLH